ncbi:lantibiotic dehydratase [Myceligenerans halotolerans]
MLQDLQLPDDGLHEEGLLTVVAQSRPFVWMREFPVLARVPLLPVESDGTTSSGSTDGDVLSEAVRFASRYTGDAVRGGTPMTPRLAQTLRAYDRRARTRPTPRGVFAGVQVADVVGEDQRTRLSLGSSHRVHTTPSAGWLVSVADRVMSLPGVLDRLTLSASNLVVRRGDCFEHERIAEAGDNVPERVTIRATPAASLILARCQSGARLRDLIATVQREWPSVPEQIVRDAVLTMVSGGFLLTDLLPERINDAPLRHMLTKLPVAAPMRDALAAIRDALVRADEYPPGDRERLAALDAARLACDNVVRVESPITSDTAVDADVVVPESLMHDAAEAVGLLWRIGHTLPVLSGYHDRFVSRYGTGRAVPLLDVLDPVEGLGGVGDEAEIRAAPMERSRLRILADLIATAVGRGETEVEIDDATISALEGRSPDRPPPPPSAEIYARVLAASSADLEAGRYHLAIDAGGTQDAGSTVGRFTSLVNLDHRGVLSRLAKPALTAEVLVRPRKPELSTAAVPAGFADTRIPVGVPYKDGDLRLDDLVLTSDGTRLMLWSRSRKCQVVPVLYSRVGSMYISPVARLLQQLALSGTTPWCAWSWGPLDDTAFQPRIRYGRTILSPARWRLDASVVNAAKDDTRWDAELDRWRASTVPQPPETVLAEEGDRQLPLALDHREDRELLRRYVRRGMDTVIEPPGESDAIQGVIAGPSGRHLLELIIPLQGNIESDSRRLDAPPAEPSVELFVPGGEWLSLAIPAPHQHHEAILERLAEVAETTAEFHDRWFWLRYDNEAYGPHLRVRFHGKPELLCGQVLPTMSAWCAGLVASRLARGLVIEPYEPEVVRYGGPEAIEAAERVFEADSEMVLATIAATADHEQRLVTAALTAAAVGRSVATGNGLEAVGRHQLDRGARRQVHRLVKAAREQQQDHGRPTGAAEPTWRAWSKSLETYRDLVPPARRADCASSLIHMHANRLLGSNDAERLARVVAAQLLAQRVQ